MENDKTPGNDGLSKEFMKYFGMMSNFHSWHRLMMLLLRNN